MANMYELELETSTERFVRIATPVLFMAMGIFVALMLMSLLQPMYSLLGHLTR